MHRLRPFLTIPIGLIIIVLAVANRHDVAVHLFPLPWDIEAPLYALLILMFALGVVAGGLAMWTGRIKRQRKKRVKAALKESQQAKTDPSSPLLTGPKSPPKAS